MPENPTPKRPRGRPPKPKEPKVPAKMGRPSVWDPALGKTTKKSETLPARFWELKKLPAFKIALNRLMLEFDGGASLLVDE